MRFTLDKIVPWGRSYDEYVSMFGLLHKRNRQNSKVQGGADEVASGELGR